MHKLLPFAVVGLVLGAAPVAAASKEEEAKKYLTELQTSKDPKVKAAAAEELGKLGQIKASYARPAIPYLIEALKDKNDALRAKAAKALGQVDPEPGDAVKPLVDLVRNDGNVQVRTAAVLGLASMGSNAKEAVPALREVAAMGKDKKGPERELSRQAQLAVQTILERTRK
jgi:HEAT repeat protein